MKAGDRVYVSEYGSGALAGRILKFEPAASSAVFGAMLVIKLDERECPVHRYASSVFKTRDAAEKDARGGGADGGRNSRRRAGEAGRAAV